MHGGGGLATIVPNKIILGGGLAPLSPDELRPCCSYYWQWCSATGAEVVKSLADLFFV